MNAAVRLARITPAEVRKLLAGPVEAPRDLSWRRALALERAGLAAIGQFHKRWCGLVELTPAGRQALDAVVPTLPEGGERDG